MTTSSTMKEVLQSDGSKIVEYLNAAGELHREDGPAQIQQYANGQIEKEGFCINGKHNRKDDPAVLWYYETGQVEYEIFCVNDTLHRIDGPARVKYYASGELAEEEFWVNGELHRIDGPARVKYYASGELAEEEFWVNGELHRIDGPATIHYNEGGEVATEWFYIDGVGLTSKEFLHRVYIDKLADPVLREQAIQLAAGSGWKVSIEQLNKAIGLTVEDISVIKLDSVVKRNSVAGRASGI